MAAVIEPTRAETLREAAEGDALLLWAAQGLAPGVRAWAAGGAVAVASPGLSCRDRLAVRGPLPAASRLVRQVLAEVGATYRPIGDLPLIEGLVREIPGLALAGSFGWMERSTPFPPAATNAHWLNSQDLDDIATLLRTAFPASYAWPGRPGVHAWAGVRDADGRLLAVAADAWSAPEVGFLAGVAAHPHLGRGRGHGREVCRLVLSALLDRCGRAALIVDDDNASAMRLYRNLGLHRRALAAACAM